MKLIETVRFPIGAESNSFFAALASALLPVLGYTENTPYYCPPKEVIVSNVEIVKHRPCRNTRNSYIMTFWLI